jgi:hypothetical protein
VHWKRARGAGTGDSYDSFLARQIGDMDKGIIEGCKDVGHAEDKFTFTDLRAESHDFLFLHYLFLGRLSHVRTIARKRKDWGEQGRWVP